MIVLGPAGDNTSRSLPLDLNALRDADAMRALQDGGHADETTEVMDYMPKVSTQDNAFSKAGSSLDEKQLLVSEHLGSKAQRMFADDTEHATSLERGNRNGLYEE